MNSSPDQLRNQLPNEAPDALPDTLIARVLTGLRDTQPSPGLNDRILHTLHLFTEAQAAKAQAPSPSLERFRRACFAAFAFPPRHSEHREEPASAFATTAAHTWRIATAATFATALLVAAFMVLQPHRSPHTLAHFNQPRSISTAPPAQTALVRPARAQTPPTPWAPPSSWVPHSSRGILRDEWATTSLHAPPFPADTAPADTLAAEALADTLAPSRPAPPLPLTPQEKLLLRVLQRNNPVELAQLDPLQRAASLARDQADFRTFFTPPAPPPQPGDLIPAAALAPTPAEISAQSPTAPITGDQP